MKNIRVIYMSVIVVFLTIVLGGCSSSGGSSDGQDSTIKVDVGPDQTVVLEDVVLLESVLTESGTDASYQWSQVSGPGVATFSSAQSKETTVTFSEIGSYYIDLLVSSDGSSAKDTVQVSVNQMASGQSGLVTRPSNTTECISPAAPPTSTKIELSVAYPELPKATSPVAMYMAPGDSSQWYVVQQTGQVLRFENEATVDSFSTFIDIDDGRLSYGGERGLLGMAFHPDFATNGYVYLSYTSEEDGLVSRVSRFSLDGTGQAIVLTSEQIIFSIEQPYSNHNGGQISFGPDSYLYIGLGDGGSGGDPREHGQNRETLYGAMLRIDVGDGTSTGYTIPADNPFASAGGRPEIYAYGLRNPWRWSFDGETGDLWAGDVGQGEYEEIDIITKGGNYGWDIMEGRHCYNASSCDKDGLILPVAEYDHTLGLAVTGGYVYRGSEIPSLEAKYLYGDYATGMIWALEATGSGSYSSTVLIDTTMNISSFAEDHDGELYVIDIKGTIHKVTGVDSGPTGIIPEQLSSWGCFQEHDTRSLSENVIPYDLNAFLWADHADKSRFMAIPDGSTIAIDDEGRFDLPEGSVVGKHFWLGNRVVETRLLLHHDQPYGWKGYSYIWDDTQTDATLLQGSLQEEIDGQVWHYPSRGQCDTCHTAVSGITLGPEVGQLNRRFTYPSTGIEANQLITLEAIKTLSAPLTDSDKATTFYAIDDTAYSAERRARSYLHANCAYCHQPGGPGGGNMDLRMSATLEMTRTCDEPVLGDTMGLDTPVIIAPGEPERSILLMRMEDLGENRMPPVATSVIDTEAVLTIRAWIEEMSECQ